MYVWDAATFKPVRTFEKLPGFVQSVSFSADGKLLAAASNDVIEVWDLDSGKQVQTLRAPKGKVVYKTAFGADGKVLVSGCSDGVVTVVVGIWRTWKHSPLPPSVPTLPSSLIVPG